MTNDKNKKFELEAEAQEISDQEFSDQEFSEQEFSEQELSGQAFEAQDGDAIDGDEASEEQWAADARRPIAYIRSVSKDELEAALPPDAPEGPYFALHDEEGRPLAVFTDAVSARLAARAHNYETVSVH